MSRAIQLVNFIVFKSVYTLLFACTCNSRCLLSSLAYRPKRRHLSCFDACLFLCLSFSRILFFPHICLHLIANKPRQFHIAQRCTPAASHEICAQALLRSLHVAQAVKYTFVALILILHCHCTLFLLFFIVPLLFSLYRATMSCE